MKNIFIILTLLTISSAVMAAPRNGPYMAIRGGADMLQMKADGEKEDDVSLAWIMAIGARLKNIRLELEWQNTAKASWEYTDVEQNRYMVQLYYDIPTRTAIRPYLNAGAGLAYTDISFENEFETFSRDKTSFAWNVGAGLGISVSNRLSFDLGYRYFNAGKPKYFDDISVKTDGHEGYFGVRFSF